MKRVLCYGVLVLGILATAMAFTLWLLFGAAARADTPTIDAGAPDSAMPVVVWHCTDGIIGGPDCEAVQGEEQQGVAWVPYPTLPSPLATTPIVKPEPYLVQVYHSDVVVEWGDGRKVSLTKLLRDVERLKREVRELRRSRDAR